MGAGHPPLCTPQAPIRNLVIPILPSPIQVGCTKPVAGSDLSNYVSKSIKRTIQKRLLRGWRKDRVFSQFSCGILGHRVMLEKSVFKRGY
jgi:hypothetical protein